MESPCINVCVMNPETGLCNGCHRTLTEIAGWGQMSSTQRQRVMAELAHRKAKATAE